MTNVSIIGTGTMAQALSSVIGKGGTTVELIAHSEPGKAVTGDIVILAVPYPAVADVVAARGDQLAGKIVVDITNPIDWSTMDSLVVPEGSSAAQEIAKHLGGGSRVVKAFNTTFAGTLVAGQVADQQLDVLLAGDDEDAKAVVRGMVEAAGMRAVDIGPLRRARQLEELGFLHISIQDKLGTGYGSAVKLIMP
jgi:NADPH-dependent F420 reductase